MSFINWGEESPEQKQIRRRFEEEQAMFEQAVMMANAANASAAAAAAAAGGSKLGESLPAYCGGDKKIADINYWGMDVLKDKRYIPSAAEFDAFVYDGDADGDHRIFRDEWLKAQGEDLLSIEFYNRPATAEYPSPVPAPGIFYRTDLLADSKISLYSENVNSYAQWASSGADVELPGVTKLRTLPAVDSEANLPLSGSPGDIVYVINTDIWYAWRQSSNSFNATHYDNYIRDTHEKMKESRDSAAKSKNELILALQPFLWASKYIPEFRIKKDNL
jgi:hypothetical protein